MIWDRHLIAPLAVCSILSALAGLLFGYWLWRVKWDARLVLIVLLLGLLGLGYEAVVLGLAAGPTRVAAIACAVGLPGTAILVLARLSRLSVGVMQVGAISGLGPSARLRLIILPMAAPAVLVGGVFAAVAAMVDGLVAPALAILFCAVVLMSPRSH